MIALHDVFAYLEAFYNAIRPHSALGWLSPASFEAVLPLLPPDCNPSYCCVFILLFFLLFCVHLFVEEGLNYLAGSSSIQKRPPSDGLF